MEQKCRKLTLQARANNEENYSISASLILNLLSSDFEAVHMSTCMKTPRQTQVHLTWGQMFQSPKVNAAGTHSLPALTTTRELLKPALLPGRQDPAPSVKEGGKMHA